MIKRVLIAGFALIASAITAQASDFSIARPFASFGSSPSADVSSNWTGFYLGGNLGALSTTKGGTDINGATGSDLAGIAGKGFGGSSKAGMTFGLVGGYNYQIMPSIVLGVEADYNWADTSRRSSFTSASDLGALGTYRVDGTTQAKLDSFGTLRGRVGYLVSPSLMIYGTAGLAFGTTKTSASFVDTLSFGGTDIAMGSSYGSKSKTQIGWTAGVGAEYALNRNWSVKVEYLYADLGSTKLPVAGAGIYDYTVKQKNEVSLFRTGLNYKF